MRGWSRLFRSPRFSTPARGAGGSGEASAFELVEFSESAVGVEDGRRERLGETTSGLGVDVGACEAEASEDGEAPLAGDDLATSAAEGCVGPGAGVLVEVEEGGENVEDVTPIGGVVGLKDEESTRDESAVEDEEESWGDESA